MVNTEPATIAPALVPLNPPEPIVHTERYIDSDGSVWRIHERDGQPVATFNDPELAEECLRSMSNPQTLNHQITLLFNEMRAIQDAQHREIREYIDLYTTGRI